MLPLVVLYENFADSGILSGGSWLAALPLANMQDPDIQRVARSSNATNAATEFIIDLGSSQQIDGVALGPINISPGASWRWRIYTDTTFLTLVYDSGIQIVTGEVIDWSNPALWLEWEDAQFWYGNANPLDELPQYLFYISPTTKLARTSYIQFFDSGNADGYIEIGRLMIARAFRPSINYSQDNSLVPEPLTDMEESLGGERSYWERGIRRKATYAFPVLAESEIFSDVFRMVLRSGISRHLFVTPKPDDTSFGNRRSFLATMSKAPPIRQFNVAQGSTAFDFEEVL